MNAPQSIEPYGEYVVGFKSISVSASSDLFEIVAPSDAVVAIHEVILIQTAAGATNEELLYTLQRITGSPTSGSGGASVTPQNAKSGGGVAAGSTVERNNTTILTGGTVAFEIPFTSNAKDSNRRILVGERPIVLSPGNTFVWRLESTPTTSLTVSAFVKFAEYGG